MWGDAHVSRESHTVAPFVRFIRLQSSDAGVVHCVMFGNATPTNYNISGSVMRAPLTLFTNLEQLELAKCQLGIANESPGPIEKLAELIQALPRLRYLGLARNSLGDGDALFLLGGAFVPRNLPPQTVKPTPSSSYAWLSPQ